MVDCGQAETLKAGTRQDVGRQKAQQHHGHIRGLEDGRGLEAAVHAVQDEINWQQVRKLKNAVFRALHGQTPVHAMYHDAV
jgi:hypothetical protein